jgi:2-C-methyl-D-erythritol 4-phosphate cytidylyltransferase
MSPSLPDTSPLEVGVIIPAAGRGERAGAGELKQFRKIAGQPMLLRAIRPFAAHPRVNQIVIALPEGAVENPPKWLGDLVGDRLRLVPGGASRTESVLEALRALRPGIEAVLIHDAARPFVHVETVSQVIDRATVGVCAVAAVPLTDTLKRADPHDRRVFETVPRRGLWRAQTPQGFPRLILEESYQTWLENRHNNLDVTDDAALVEAAGFPVELVPDRTTNLKVTTPEDFWLAEALAAR